MLHGKNKTMTSPVSGGKPAAFLCSLQIGSSSL